MPAARRKGKRAYIMDKTQVREKRMGRIIKMKLKALEEGQFEIEEMTVSLDDGAILGVIPEFYYKEYKGQSLYADTCLVGERPILVRALAIFNLRLPGIVTDVIDWIDKDYDWIDKILFYPVTVDDGYQGTVRRELAVSLDKGEYQPLYRRYVSMLAIKSYCRNELSGDVSFPVELYEKDLKRIFRTRKPICILMREQIEKWQKELSFQQMVFVVEYVSLTGKKRRESEYENKK